MGINNFVTYAEKALKWTTGVYYGHLPVKKGLAGVEYDKGINEEMIENLLKNSNATQRYSVESDVRGPSKEKTEYGICVDLSSFCYGSIVNAVAEFQNVTQSGKNNTDVFDESEVYADLVKKQKLEFDSKTLGEKELRPTAGRESHRGTRKPFSEDKPINDEIVLNKELINLCAMKCLDKLFDVIGFEAITRADYVSLHFDENTTTCKWYEQFARRIASQTVVSKESRRRIFVRTIELVYQQLFVDARCRLDERNAATDVNGGKELVSDDVHKAVKRKMQLTCDGHGGVDGESSPSWQRYKSGEGEWKCFYAIRDVECDDETEEGKRQWFVFGSDSDIGLGMLLYTTKNTSVHYVNNYRKMFAFPAPYEHKNLRAYKALHFFSLSLLGNDFVPRMVNESSKHMAALGKEVDRMISSEERHCKSCVERLSNMFREEGVACESDEKATPSERSTSARAIAYVFARLLLAVYNEDRVQSVERAHASAPNPTSPGLSVVDKTSLRCKDGKQRCFTECFATFALRVMWYLAYCLFYTNMGPRQREEFRTKDLKKTDIHLCVRGLPMKNCFSYNERRLHEEMQFGLTNIIDVRHAVGNLTTVSLISILEKGMLDVFES